MSLDLNKLGFAFKGHYEKMAVVAVLVGLIASIFLLGVRAAVARKDQKEFQQRLTGLRPEFPRVEAIAHEPFADALGKIQKPFQLSIVSTESLTVPPTRVSCVNMACKKPIEYLALVCPFCGKEQPGSESPPEGDDDGDGMSNEWEAKYQLDPNNSDDASEDPDDDGFTNLEEFRSTMEYGVESDPTDAESAPPAYAFGKLVAGEIRVAAFNMIFKSYMRGEDKKMIFSINHVEGQTYWKRMGEQVLSFTIADFVQKTMDVPTPSLNTIKKEDVSELTLQAGEKKIVLVMNRKQGDWEKSAKLRYVPTDEVIVIKVGQEVLIKGQKYLVKDIDAKKEKVILFDFVTNKEVPIGR
jgi:hypothetical protein